MSKAEERLKKLFVDQRILEFNKINDRISGVFLYGIISGIILVCSKPNKVPVLPKHVCISSKIIKTSYFLHTLFNSTRNSFDATIKPLAP